MHTRLKIAGAVLAVAAFAAGCTDKQRERFQDAPRASNNDDAAETFTMPDGFSNGAHKCVAGFRVFVIFKGDSAYGAIDAEPDSSCREGDG